MTTFPQVRIGDICKLINGKAFKPEDWSTTGAPIIRIQNLNDPSKPFNYWDGSLGSQVRIKSGDVLFAWSGTPGTSFGAHIWHGPAGILNQHIFLVDLYERIITKDWWVYTVNNQINELIGLAHGGVGLKHVTRRMIDDMLIPLPPLDEQKRITAILDQADALRRKRKQTLDRLNQLGQAIFYEMFGDPATNPKGWPVVSLGDLVSPGDKINYGVVQPGEDVEKGVPLVRVGDLLSGFIDPRKVKQIDPAIEANYRRSRLNGDEILIGCVGSIGAVALAHSGLKGANIARAVARVSVDPRKAVRAFVAEQIKSPFVQNYFSAETRTVAQPTLNIGLIVETPVILPPIEKQAQFARMIGEIGQSLKSAIDHEEIENALFSSLQHRAFRGEL